MALERILVNGASEMLKKLITVVGSETSLAWGVKGELKTLKETLEVIEAKTSDAERKQVNDAAVLLWLKRLKEVSYDADDVLDEYTYEAMRRSNNERKVKDFFSSSNQVVFRFKMAHKIKGINTQLNQIATDMQRFQFETTSSTSGGYEQHNKRLTTSFFGDVSKFVGREADKSKILKMITTIRMSSSLPSTSSVNSNINIHEKVSVISIVGMGGLGKTSLTQTIYNDKSVERYFDKKMWVCISDEFDVLTILKKIMESVTDSRCEDFLNPDVLEKKIREELEGKKYLLVLDDLWNEDSMEWNKLKSFLDSGSVGSKVIVTTRSQKVASVVQGLIPPYNLKLLSEAECWSIIKNKAFSPGGASETPNMEIIGEQIAKSCGGLPLAAIFFGCLMHKQSDERQWLSIRDNKSLETLENPSGGIIPILKLSYDTLPSHLKKCFSYCCLFPKDWEFERETLIRLWMAEGFIHPSNGGNHRNSLENIGNDYFLSLLSSSFFQDVVKDFFSDIKTFKMHDLVHDLALSVVGSHEATTLKTNEMKTDVFQIRRKRLIVEGIPRKEFDVLENTTKLRTIFFQGKGFVFPLSNKRLRVIHRLVVYRRLETISSPAFKFKHMRYLDLHYYDFKDVHADSIHQLYNLQTLNLRFSQNVQNILKEGFGCLINLRHLNLSYSDANLLPDSITRLTNLQSLDITHCRDIGVLPTNIGYLLNLSSLHISFTYISELPDSISVLYNLTKFMLCSKLQALPQNFGALTQLRSLDFRGTGITELPESLTSTMCKLEYVNFGVGFNKLPKDIKNWVELRHLEYWGNKWNQLIMPRGIGNLTRLKVLMSFIVRKQDDTCSYNSSSSSIQELADLNSLRKLKIVSLENVRGGKIEAEMAKLKDKKKIQHLDLTWYWSFNYGFIEEEEVGEVVVINSAMVLEGLQPHPNVKKIYINGFPVLKTPKWMGSSSCLPNLVTLKLGSCNSCTKLVGLGQLPCLQILRIHNMDSIKCLGDEFYYQQDEEDTKGSASTLFPSLTMLHIRDLKNLEEWFAPPPPYNSFPCLDYVKIQSCNNLNSVSDLRLWTSSLTKLIIRDCKKLEKEPIAYYFCKYLPFVRCTLK